MSVGYRAVGWYRQKKLYDLTLLSGVFLYTVLFVGVGALVNPQATAETLVIRAFGTGAFVLLHLVLSIGPLCRLDPRFLPLLYNRRHMGVTLFVMALGHGLFALFQFHALGNADPLLSLFSANPRYDSLTWFPFQPLGFGALAILFLMAATSHDFWLANLGAPVWKALHMGVYLAYALVVGHVVLGALQSESHSVLTWGLGIGVAWILPLHLVAGWRERGADRAFRGPDEEGFLDLCSVHDLEDGRAKVVTLGKERVAVFRYGERVAAVSNVCQHQNGPLGEGRVLDGCITCPWHGYQYRPEDGRSPAPFTERISTFEVRLAGDRVWIDPIAKPPGTAIPPAEILRGASSNTKGACRRG